MGDKFVWALYHVPTKSFLLSAGYYGNECNIRAFELKHVGQNHINSHYSGGEYKLKRMRIKP